MKGVAVALFASLNLASLLAGITFQDIQSEGTQNPVLAKVSSHDDLATSGTLLADIQENKHRYQAWAGASPEGLMLLIRVKAPWKPNPNTGRDLWRGDCVFVGIDGRGDSKGEALTSKLPPDDLSVIFGIGADGPDGWIERTGNTALTGEDARPMIQGTSRDQSTTTYNLCIPWPAIGQAPGQTDEIGLALCFKDSRVDEKVDVDWGSIRESSRPREFRRFRIPPPTGEVFSLVPINRRCGPGNVAFEIGLAWRGKAGQATIDIGSELTSVPLPASSSVRRWRVRIPSSSVDSKRGIITISAQAGGESRSETVSVEDATILKNRLDQRIEKLLETSPHPLLTEHLQSTARIVQEAYRNLEIAGERPGHRTETDDENDFIDAVSVILGALPVEKMNWDVHLKKCLPLVIAFISRVDSTLQFFSIQMPYGWMEGKPYPLLIYLHGYGAHSPIAGLLNCFDTRGQHTLFTKSEMDPDRLPSAHKGFIVAPWCRGNMAYKGVAAEDFWQILDLVKSRFSVREDRIYLSGFSMGCNGAFVLAAQKPQLWAGLLLASGFSDHMEIIQDASLLEKLRGVPIMLWCGEEDGMFAGAKIFRDRLEAGGYLYQARFAPVVSHTYPHAIYMENFEDLLRMGKENRFQDDGMAVKNFPAKP